MKRIITTLCIVAIVMCTFPVASAKPLFTKDFEWEALSLCNDERAKQNLMPLSTFDSLQRAATIRANELVQLFSHTRPDGSGCFTVLDEIGVDYFFAGENLAGGQRSPSEAVTAWMNSSGHRENILSGNYRHLAVAYCEANTAFKNYWAQFLVGGCRTTAIAIEGDTLRVSCDLHPDSYIPLENVQTETLADGMITVTYDGFTTSGLAPAPQPDYFVDVPDAAWFKEYVDYSVANGIFKGKNKVEFAPNDNITRAQFVQVLANLEGVDTSNRNVITSFSDVPAKKWFTAAVKWASENKIVNGVGDGKFDPSASVTREQMCVMLVNYAKFKNITLNVVEAKENFADDTSISKWAKTEVYICQQADIVNGKGAGKFDPQGTGTRAEASVIFTKFHKEYLTK